MQIGMIGLGRMGANMARRLLQGGHQCVVYDTSSKAVKALTREKAVGASSLADLVKQLEAPRAIWMMIPAAFVEQLITELLPHLEPGDILIDGGNSCYVDDIRIANELAARNIHYIDCGTSGGVMGLERGYSLMIGGPDEAVKRLDPVFKTLAPGVGDIPSTPGREKLGGTAEQGYLHCGPSGAGHFVKMVHNGIEYGLMAAYAEGMNILKHANVGKGKQDADAETAPLRNPEAFQFDLNLRDIAYFKKHRSQYYDHLQAVRELGDWEGWMQFFFQGVTEVAGEAALTARRILQVREEARGLVTENLGRAAGNGHRMLEHLFDRPMVSVADIRKLLDITPAGANNLVSRLEAIGILREFTGYARNRRYRFEPYLKLFEE